MLRVEGQQFLNALHRVQRHHRHDMNATSERIFRPTHFARPLLSAIRTARRTPHRSRGAFPAELQVMNRPNGSVTAKIAPR
jgi:hypothetical protein